MKKKTVLRVLKYTLSGLWWLALLLGAVLIVSFVSAHFRGEVPRIGNYSVMHIVSESMEPTIEKDTYVLIKRVAPEEVKKGDIICFYSTDPTIYGYPNTHRVVEEPRMQDGNLVFDTKGDHNLIPDKEPAQAEHLIGVWVRNLTAFTAILNFLTQNFFLIFLLLALLGVAAALGGLFLGNGKKGKKEESKAQE
jgi:signal peptidase I